MIKTFFNLFVVAALVLGSAFLYGAFKQYELTNTETLEDIKSEIVEEVEDSLSETGFENYIAGSWKSVTDSKNSMVLKEDPNASHGQGGIIENIYDGEVMDSGTWIIDGYKLVTIINDEEFEYTVVFAGSERLELTFLSGGNTLHFFRIDLE